MKYKKDKVHVLVQGNLSSADVRLCLFEALFAWVQLVDYAEVFLPFVVFGGVVQVWLSGAFGFFVLSEDFVLD